METAWTERKGPKLKKNKQILFIEIDAFFLSMQFTDVAFI
jgi:hypothetical protein